MEMAVSEMWLGDQRHFTGILRDITARKQAEEALLKAGALQSAIFNSANFSSIATDAKGVIQSSTSAPNACWATRLPK